jgi:hypothetical protein
MQEILYVHPVSSLSGVSCRRRGRLWKSLWNCGTPGKCLTAKSGELCHPGGFSGS